MTTIYGKDAEDLLNDLQNGCGPEEAGRRIEHAKRELAAMGLGPAAGPWIRVDSGERPEAFVEEVMLWDERIGEGALGRWAGYAWETDDEDCYPWTHWARVYPPRKP